MTERAKILVIVKKWVGMASRKRVGRDAHIAPKFRVKRSGAKKGFAPYAVVSSLGFSTHLLLDYTQDFLLKRLIDN